MKFHDAWLSIALRPFISYMMGSPIKELSITVEGGIIEHLWYYLKIVEYCGNKMKAEKNIKR